jgi:DNA-binding PucR family transcriptional regulator
MPTLCAAVLPDRRTVSDVERTRLIDTIRVYLRTGSVAATAAAMYCHRNTVVNRLNRFGDLTGHDVTRPDHAAAVSVALACESPKLSQRE